MHLIIKMEMIHCLNCNFRFESKEQKRCPYCENNNLEKEKSAEELVEDIKIE